MLPKLYDNYIATGKLQLVFMDLPFQSSGLAFRAAEAAHCAGEQDRYWDMHHQLFSNPEELAEEHFPAHGEVIGLEPEAFAACLKKHRHAGGINEDKRVASILRIRSTPTWVIGKRDPKGKVEVLEVIPGAAPYEVLAAKLDSHAPAAP